MKNVTINFASENFAGVHPAFMQALADANAGNMRSYGNDPITHDAIKAFKQVFGQEIEVYFTFNGTGANNFGLSCMVEKHHSIFCTDVAHLFVDEATAPEAFVGCRIYPVNSLHGKMQPDDLRTRIKRAGDMHHPQPKVVTLTQPTEYGTVYTTAELKAIKAICAENNMLLHVDGARFFNAAAHSQEALKTISADAGVDVLTLGGTKTGLMFGEAVIFFNPKKDNAYKFNLKRSMQLASKNRFIAAQFVRLFKYELWQTIATHTNQLALYFEKQIRDIQSLTIAHAVETNAVFVTMPKPLHQQLQSVATFYYWNDEKQEARLVFSFNNTIEEIDAFIAHLKSML